MQRTEEENENKTKKKTKKKKKKKKKRKKKIHHRSIIEKYKKKGAVSRQFEGLLYIIKYIL